MTNGLKTMYNKLQLNICMKRELLRAFFFYIRVTLKCGYLSEISIKKNSRVGNYWLGKLFLSQWVLKNCLFINKSRERKIPIKNHILLSSKAYLSHVSVPLFRFLRKKSADRKTTIWSGVMSLNEWIVHSSIKIK